MALTFDTHEAIRKLRGRGYSEPQAEGAVELVQDATSPLVTRDHFDTRLDARFAEQRAEAQVFRSDMDAKFAALNVRFAEQRAEMYRALLIQGGIIIGAVVALVKLL